MLVKTLASLVRTLHKIAKSAGKKYGSKKAGERVAGAILNKMRNEGMTLRTKSGRYLTENEVQQAQVMYWLHKTWLIECKAC